MSRLRSDHLWTNGSAMTAAEWNALDAALTGAINGDGGGTYTCPFVVGGAGVVIASDADVSGAALAPTSITFDGGWVEYSPAKTRTVSTPAELAVGATITPADVSPGVPESFDVCVRPVGAAFSIPLRVLTGATLGAVRVVFWDNGTPPGSAVTAEIAVLDDAGEGDTFELTYSSTTYDSLDAKVGSFVFGGLADPIVADKRYWLIVREPSTLAIVYSHAECDFTGIASNAP